jgi:hypothetical protein
MLHDSHPSLLEPAGGADAPLDLRTRTGYPARGPLTTPLVGLLHRRTELRDAVPAAAMIDACVRDCA